MLPVFSTNSYVAGTISLIISVVANPKDLATFANHLPWFAKGAFLILPLIFLFAFIKYFYPLSLSY